MPIFRNILLVATVALLFISCGEKKSMYPDQPSLRLLSQNTDVINYTDSNSMLLLNFELIDGDGDLGKREPGVDSSIIALVIRENDSSNSRHVFPLPQIDEDEYLKGGALKANMKITLQNYFFYPRVDSAHLDGLDTMHLGIFVQDYSGKSSDTIMIGPIYMEP